MNRVARIGWLVATVHLLLSVTAASPQAGLGPLWRLDSSAPSDAVEILLGSPAFNGMAVTRYTVDRARLIEQMKSIALGATAEVELPVDGRSVTFTVERLRIATRANAEFVADFRRFRGIPTKDATLLVEARIAMRNDEVDLIFIRDDAIIISHSLDDRVLLLRAPLEWQIDPPDNQCRAVDRERPVDPTRVLLFGATKTPPPMPLRELVFAAMPSRQFWTGAVVNQSRSAYLWRTLRLLNAVAGTFRRELNVELVPVIDPGLVPPDTFTAWTQATTFDHRVAMAQSYLDGLLGHTGYDIGHVLTPAKGGIGNFRTACVRGHQASGETGIGQPSDARNIAVLAHEIAHQFDAHHSYNGNCVGRDPAGAFEPGPGNTLMGYQGPCEAGQRPYLAVFHEQNVAEMLAHIANSCPAPVGTSAGNLPPVITVPRDSVPLLKNTGFALTATWKDPEQAPVRIRWTERFAADRQLGVSPPAYLTATTAANRLELAAPAAVWRGGDPSGSLTFAATGRDGTGGYAVYDVTGHISSVRAVKIATPRGVRTGAPFAVTWTPEGPVDALYRDARLRIVLSTDGGKTYPHLLADDVASDQAVTVCSAVPAPASAARLRLEARTGGFFVVSEPFSIAQGAAACPASP